MALLAATTEKKTRPHTHGFFIPSKSMLDLGEEFGLALRSVKEFRAENPVATISLIGQQGIGKTTFAEHAAPVYISLYSVHTQAQGYRTAQKPGSPIWSLWEEKGRQDPRLQVFRVDEASLRFVSSAYPGALKNEPVPERKFGGIDFIEHPTQETENKSDIVITFSSGETTKSFEALRDLEDAVRHIAEANTMYKNTNMADHARVKEFNEIGAQIAAINKNAQIIRGKMLAYPVLVQINSSQRVANSAGFQEFLTEHHAL